MQALNSLWRWPIFFAAWTLLALAFATQFHLSSAQAGLAIGWRQALAGAFGDWYVVAVLSWPVIFLARRCTITRECWRRCVAIHVAAAVAFSASFILLRAGVAQWQGWAAHRPVEFLEAVRPLAIKTWLFNLLLYGVIVAIAQGIRFYRESQERFVRALELEKRLAEARLMALQMQLNPHFLFNALNSIATLIHRDARAADRMLIRLAELLRFTLESTTTQEVPLRAELELLERYLDIERVRFGDRLSFRLEVPEETRAARVPTLLLQPIVENALQHGLSSQARAGVVEITAARVGDRLRIEVRDNGRGLRTDRPPRDGIGLSNTRARLQHLYGTQQELRLANDPGGGVRVTLELPFQSQPKA